MPVESSKRETARRLRRTMTEAERRLWLELKRIPVEGSHFRRQVPIGPFVADFACLAARLVIELDGGQHTEDAHAVYDSRRSAWLAREGYRVIRFQNTEVIDRPDDVLDTIYAAVFGGPDAEAARLRHQRRRRGAAPPRR